MATRSGFSRWRLNAAKAFQEPIRSRTLCIMVGYGVHIAGLVTAIILSSALGFASTRGLEAIIVIAILSTYLGSALASGYLSVWLWRSIKGSSEGWPAISSSTCLLAGFGFVVLTLLNIFDYAVDKSSPTLASLMVHFVVLALWMSVTVALTRCGGFLAAASNVSIKNVVTMDKNAREVQMLSWVMALVSGILPLGFILIELYFAVVATWLGKFSCSFVAFTVPGLLLVISCVSVSVGVTYRCVATEDWMWWWKAFFASGSSGLYLFLLSVKYVAVDLSGQNGLALTVVYVGYATVLSIAVMLFTGTVGFLSAYGFLRYFAFSEKPDLSLCVYQEL